MRLAVFIESPRVAGGAFAQSITVVTALAEGLRGHDVVVLSPDAEVIATMSRLGIAAHHWVDPAPARLFDLLPALWPQLEPIFAGLRRLGLRGLGRSLDRRLAALGVDVAYFNTLADTSLRLSEHPYVMTVWDIGHRLEVEFPELTRGREFERREQRLVACLTKSIAVVTPASTVAERIARRYHVDPQRLLIFEPVPSMAVRAAAAAPDVAASRQRFGLPHDYIFYPAQFWPHKNHVYILEAVAELRDRYGREIDIVFAGGDRDGGIAHSRRRAAALGLADRLHILGFITEEALPDLYRGARALVMPSYIEPTNIPPFEAAILGCPVIYTDTPESRALLGEAALYCELSRPGSLTEALHALLGDPALTSRLIAAGHARAALCDPQRYAEEIQKVLDDYAYKRRLWP